MLTQATNFQRWQPGDFSRPASLTRTMTSATGESINLPTASQIEELHQQAQQEGYAAGYEEGTARVRMEAAQLHVLFENLGSALAALDQQVAEELLALALEIARQVVRETLAVKPESILTVVREALRQLPQQHATVFVHPEDAVLLRSRLSDQLAHAGQRIQEDTSLERGGCRIESANSQIDGSLATRWRRVLENMGAASAWLDRP